jgi:hypothetical protein
LTDDDIAAVMPGMEVLLTSNDPIRLGFLLLFLRGEGFEPVVFDAHMAVLEGSAGAIQRRLAVPLDQAASARRALAAAGEL